MAFTPHTVAHSGERLGNGRVRLSIPGGRTPRHRGGADQGGRHHGHSRIPRQPGRWGPSRRLLTPLARRLDPTMGSRVCDGRLQWPAPDDRRQDLGRRQPRVRRPHGVGCDASVRSTPHAPAHGHPGRPRVRPDGRLRWERDPRGASAVPGRHGHRRPGRCGGGHDLRQGGPPLPRLAGPSVRPRLPGQGRLLAGRVASPTGAAPHGVTDGLAPLRRGSGGGTHDATLALGPPAAPQPHRWPGAVPQGAGGTAAVLSITRRGRQPREPWPSPATRRPGEPRQAPQAHPTPAPGVAKGRLRGTDGLPSHPVGRDRLAAPPVAGLVDAEHHGAGRHDGAPQPSPPQPSTTPGRPWRPTPHPGRGLAVPVITLPQHAPHGGDGSLPRREESADHPQLPRRQDTRRAHRSTGSEPHGKGRGQDQHRRPSLGEKDTPTASLTRRLGLNRSRSMDKVELSTPLGHHG